VFYFLVGGVLFFVIGVIETCNMCFIFCGGGC